MSFRTDLWKYAPPFTEADEWEAQKQGYDSAFDKWTADLDWKHWAHQYDRKEKRWKAQAESDLHSINCPYDRLGAIAEAAGRLPGSPDYVEPEPQSTKNPVTRAARVHGLIRYAERLMKTAERKGGPWRTALQKEDAHNPEVAHLKAEWENVRQRLEVLGEDLDEVAEGIVSGEVEVTEEFEADIPPDDPELQRVYDAWNRDQQAAKSAWEDTEEEAEDDSTAHEWMAERDEDLDVDFGPIPRGGPNGQPDAPWWKEADGWDADPVYSEWNDEEE